jgi:hypothetical protein
LLGININHRSKAIKDNHKKKGRSLRKIQTREKPRATGLSNNQSAITSGLVMGN